MSGSLPDGTRAAVITASNRSARGERADSSGELLADRLRALGCSVGEVTVVPDDVPAIQAALRAALADRGGPGGDHRRHGCHPDGRDTRSDPAAAGA